jgi:PAS domain-containing protein
MRHIPPSLVAMLLLTLVSRRQLDERPEWIMERDREGVMLWVNTAVAQAWGTAREAIIGQRFYDLLGSRDAMRVQRQDVEILTTGKPLHASIEAFEIGGRTHIVRADKHPLPDRRILSIAHPISPADLAEGGSHRSVCICAQCGRVAKRYRPWQRYCSPVCRQAAYWVAKSMRRLS